MVFDLNWDDMRKVDSSRSGPQRTLVIPPAMFEVDDENIWTKKERIYIYLHEGRARVTWAQSYEGLSFHSQPKTQFRGEKIDELFALQRMRIYTTQTREKY